MKLIVKSDIFRRVKMNASDENFNTCQNSDDAFNLDLCVFVMEYILRLEHNKSIEDKYLHMVENLPFFYSLPWENITWTETCASLSVDLSNYCDNFQNKLGNDIIEQKEVKYTLTRNLHVVQYWAYEVILEIG